MIDIDKTENQVKLLQSKSFIRMQLGLPEVLELIELVRKERERAEAYKTMQRETAKAGREIRAERDAALAALERVRALETFSITDSYPAWTAVDHDDLLAALDGAPEPDTITIPRPVVPFGPVSKTENEATADYLLEVVKKINGKYCTVGGSNVTAAVRKLLTDAADAVRGLPVEGEVKGNV